MTSALQRSIQRTQREPLIGRDDMVENNAGGMVFQISDIQRLRRFLIIGTDGGTYYTGERDLTRENVDFVVDMIKRDGARVVDTVHGVSVGGNAPKNDQAIFTLALCIIHGDADVRERALLVFNAVVRIGTHLFQFMDFYKKLGGGFGRSVKRTVANWYNHFALNEGGVDRLAYQMCKYRNRAGWTHRDVLRVVHPKTDNPAIKDLFDWACHPTKWKGDNIPLLVRSFEMLQLAADSKSAAFTLELDHELSHDMLPTHLKDKVTWQELLPRLPLRALIRQLPTLTRLDMLRPLSDNVEIVRSKLTNADALKRARIHPLHALVAHEIYKTGRSDRGRATWTPNRQVVDMLDECMHMTFDQLDEFNQRVYVGLDVSGSMGSQYGERAGPLTAAQAGAAITLALIRQTKRSVAYGFASDRTWGSLDMRDLHIGKQSSLDDVMRNVVKMTFGPTDCAMPMLHATNEGLLVDLFVVITDNETWHGEVHPSVALRHYRKEMGINAKLIVIGLTSTGFSIADPRDAYMMDIAGFDPSIPTIIEGFMGEGETE